MRFEHEENKVVFYFDEVRRFECEGLALLTKKAIRRMNFSKIFLTSVRLFFILVE